MFIGALVLISVYKLFATTFESPYVYIELVHNSVAIFIGLLNTLDTHKREFNHRQYILCQYLQQSSNAGVIFRFRNCRNRMGLS